MKDKIIPGWVYLLYFHALYGGGKDKFCILTCVEPKTLFLLINTQPSKLKQEQPELSECQVLIDAKSHNFLDYDSYIDCTEALGYDINYMMQQLEADRTRIKCQLSDPILNAVIKAIENNVIPRRQIDWMLKGLKK